ncbi:hypothetical protein [uncultured Microbulbifer sp.]|uniref:hypothetical protein n=1 Tax=uncultured Microbulbifer sp. TaxID=348147 RepID=UPI00260E7C05|nr:hypothetical protein [uncultured Microbulbifer sp.]
MKTLAYTVAALAGLAVLGIGGRTVTRPTLQYFKPSEFGIWYPLMAADLLTRLDLFRERWGAPVIISPAQGGIGRHGGEGDTSQHNIDRWGEVRAIDIFPTVGGNYITTTDQLKRAAHIAREVGFTGVGVYTDTKPGHMVHVDVRPDRNSGDPATWSRVAGNYYALGAAFV